jgi:uncharacterized membrane protein
MKKIFNICYLIFLLILAALTLYMVFFKKESSVYLLFIVAIVPAVYLTVKDIRR